jgi:hypothetical protein
MKRSLYVAFAAGLALAAPVRSFAQPAGPPDIDAALMSVAAPGVVAGGSQLTTPLETPPETEPAGEPVEGVEGPESPNDPGPNVDHQFEGEETGENGDGVEPPGGPGQ